MKKIILKFKLIVFCLMGLIMCGVLSSCKKDEEDVIWDYSPLAINIIVLDAEGHNILNPDVEGSLYGTAISVTYNDETYQTKWTSEDWNTRYLAPYFTGLTFKPGKVWEDGQSHPVGELNHLSFGEFESSHDVTMYLTLHIPTLDKEYEIECRHTFRWVNKEPHQEDKYFVDGVSTGSEYAVITVPESMPL